MLISLDSQLIFWPSHHRHGVIDGISNYYPQQTSMDILYERCYQILYDNVILMHCTALICSKYCNYKSLRQHNNAN